VTALHLAALAALLAQPGPSPAPVPGDPLDPAALLVPQDAPELLRQPALRAKLEGRPYAYFRFINTRFMTLLCERFSALVAAQPTVTLHGDAHLEQYAVTDGGRGLTDFDDATSGPALLDLARFATSIRLALRERSWPEAEALVSTFLEGYARALREPKTEAPEPALARRLKGGFERDRLACLARAEAYMRDLPEDSAPKAAVLREAARQLAQAADKPVSFFTVKRVGALTLGIGSAADEKYLFRIEGPSPAAADDVILEIKEVRTLPTLGCIKSEQGPTRIVVGQSHLAYEPFQYVGALTLSVPEDPAQAGAGPRHVPESRFFWFHAWPDNYAELDIRTTPESPAELREVVYDVGVQLGRGHAKGVTGGEAGRLRRTLIAALQGSQIQALSARLADATEAAWRQFRDAAKAGGHTEPGTGGRP
jgi:hypothetical protein